MAAISVPQPEIDDAKVEVRRLAIEWFGENPIRLHSSTIAEDGSPELHHDFVDYLEDGLTDKRNAARHSKRVEIDSPKRRVTKAFRVLRRRAPKEFDVAYCMVVLDQVGRSLKHTDSEGLDREFETSLRRTRQRMNLRAAKRNEQPLSEEELLVLVVSAVRKLKLWSG